MKETKERINFATRRIKYSNENSYVEKAEKLYQKAIELENIYSKYSTWHLNDVVGDEVELLKYHKYEYKKQSNTPMPKSINELQKLKHKVTSHIQSSFYGVLGKIKIE